MLDPDRYRSAHRQNLFSALLGRIGRTLGSLAHHPIDALSNPYASLASLVAMFGTFVADRYGAGYLPLLGITLVIFLFGIFSEARKAAIYTQEIIPLPVVINISNPADSNNALNSLFSLIEKNKRYRNHRNNLAQFLQILPPGDLVFNYNGNIYDTERLTDFLKVTRHDLEGLKKHTPNHTEFYLAYIGPASVGFLVGTMLGIDGLRLFQYSKSSDSYYEVISIRDRQLKEQVNYYRQFEVERSEKQQPKVTIAIDVASHKIRLSEPSIQTYGDVIYLKSKSMGTIAWHEDWLSYCQEIYQILNEAQQQYDEIRLVYSMPVTLAVTVGIAAQNYWNILLTNYESSTGTYENLLKLNQVRYYF
jgi:hypothetical protein